MLSRKRCHADLNAIGPVPGVAYSNAGAEEIVSGALKRPVRR
jgi:hypothetical protein